MQIISGDQALPTGVTTSIALGTFDGMHIGHQHILHTAKAQGKALAAFSFENIPAAHFNPAVKAIFTREEKIQAFSREGVQYLILRKFDRHIMDMPARDFLDYLQHSLHAEVIVCGFNFSFGRNAEGKPALLQQYARTHGIRAIVCEPVNMQNMAVSSTQIREAIAAGDIPTVNALLGRAYALQGIVHSGKHLGHQIGFPTANISIPMEKLSPKRGVYATIAVIDNRRYPAMTNIGVRPTVENSTVQNAETHIIGFEGDLYGRELTILFCSYLREEKRFAGVDSLVSQLCKDKEIALQKCFPVLK